MNSKRDDIVISVYDKEYKVIEEFFELLLMLMKFRDLF